MSKNSRNQNDQIYEAEVLESTTLDDNLLKKILIRAGRLIALPALEALEMILDRDTPQKVKVSLLTAIAYLIMPLDLVPDFIPAVGFSDDYVALIAVITLWSQYRTPAIRHRAQIKLDKWFSK